MILLILACRPEMAAPDYPEPQPWVHTGDDFYDDPLQEGEERLGLGIFYEGASTEALVIDDVVNHFYIYSNTFTMTASDNRWEGYASDVITNNGVGWWGGGIHWDQPQDLQDWDVLHLALRTAVDRDWEIGLTGGTEVRVSVMAAGLVADNEWHVLEIPLASYAAGGADLSAVTVGLLLIGEGGTEGEEVQIDDLYFSRSRP